jgi:hypothetical protein
MAIEAAGKRYLRTKLSSPITTKDRGTLLTVQQAWDYTAVIGKERETRSQWQKVRTLILEEADVAVVSWHVRLALLQDAKLDAPERPGKMKAPVAPRLG